jgi:phage tail-like protein
MNATGKRVDPYGNFNFLLEIDGITRGAFQECSGLDSTIDVIEHREGGAPMSKLPGLTKYSNITLKWGLTDDTELYDWHQRWVEGKVMDRKTGSVVLVDRHGNRKVQWDFFDAWPCKWVGPDFNAEGNDVAVETLELAHEGIKRVGVQANL